MSGRRKRRTRPADMTASNSTSSSSNKRSRGSACGVHGKLWQRCTVLVTQQLIDAREFARLRLHPLSQNLASDAERRRLWKVLFLRVIGRGRRHRSSWATLGRLVEALRLCPWMMNARARGMAGPLDGLSPARPAPVVSPVDRLLFEDIIYEHLEQATEPLFRSALETVPPSVPDWAMRPLLTVDASRLSGNYRCKLTPRGLLVICGRRDRPLSMLDDARLVFVPFRRRHERACVDGVDAAPTLPSVIYGPTARELFYTPRQRREGSLGDQSCASIIQIKVSWSDRGRFVFLEPAVGACPGDDDDSARRPSTGVIGLSDPMRCRFMRAKNTDRRHRPHSIYESSLRNTSRPDWALIAHVRVQVCWTSGDVEVRYASAEAVRSSTSASLSPASRGYVEPIDRVRCRLAVGIVAAEGVPEILGRVCGWDDPRTLTAVRLRDVSKNDGIVVPVHGDSY